MPKKKRQVAKEKALHVASKVSAKVQDGVHMMARRVQGEDKDAEEGAGLLMDDGIATHAHEAMTARRGGDGWQGAAVSDELPMHRSPEHGGNGADEIAAVPRKGSERDHGHKGAHAEQAEDAVPSRKAAAGHRNNVEMAEMNNHGSRSKYSAVQIEIPSKGADAGKLQDQDGIINESIEIWDGSSRSYAIADGGVSHLVVGQDQNLCSNRRAFINVLKSFIGSGVMGVPFAFSMGGLVGGVVGMFVVSLVSNYCVYLLLVAKAKIGPRARTIGDIGRESLGRLGHAAVELCVVLSQMGFCTMYLIFISQNMSIYLSGISVKEIVVLTLPILVLLCWIGSLKLLAPTSVLALSLLFFGLYYVLQEAAPNLQDATTIKLYKPETYALFLGMAIYSFEGIAMAIPIEASMKRPEYFPIVWLSGCTFVTVLYTSFGAFVYACYGDAVPSIITLALPAGSMTAAVKISICISLILTYPLMMFPVFEIAEGHWARRLFQEPPMQLHDIDEEEEEMEGQTPALAATPRHFVTPKARRASSGAHLHIPVDFFRWRRRIFRLMLVCLTALVACVVPDFGLVMSFIGAFPCNLLAFVLPTLFHAALFWDQMGLVGKLSDLALMLCGCGAVVICTWASFFGGAKHGGR